MKRIILLALLFSSHAVWASSNSCNINPEKIGAKYSFYTESYKSMPNSFDKHKHTTFKSLNIWRQEKHVAHEHPDDNITEIWNLVSDGRVRPVRYFDNDKRAIEYQPSDVNRGKGDRNWLAKNQLISDAFLTTFELKNTNKAGCDLEETYVYEKAGRTIEIVWLPALKLVKSYNEKSAKGKYKWQMNELIKNPKASDEFFAARQSYMSTDYADIGDNESDPFLMSMINLGFVEHGASGFYNADGKPLAGAGHRH